MKKHQFVAMIAVILAVIAIATHNGYFTMASLALGLTSFLIKD